MSFSTVLSAAVEGLRVDPVHVEADVSSGLPVFHMVGYLSSEVKEAGERVRTAILGTRARKVRSKSYSAFDSINYPVAAFIDDKRILRYTDTEPAHPGVRFFDALHPKVFLLKLIPGMEPEILEYLADHYDAIVIESYGVGGIPFHNKRNFLQKLQALTEKGKLVVLATQVMLEGSDAEVYEVGARAIRQYNALQAYDMTVEAAVVKLMWIMGQTRDPEKMRQLFYQPVQHDILV